MRRYGLYDATRGLMTAVAVGVAGLLLWAATQVGMQSTARFWESMGIVAAAGLLLALLPAMGGWTSGLRFRLSPGTFLLGFVPALVLVGWVLMATQPGHGWHDGTITSWSRSIGVLGLVHDLGLWHGVLAFGLGAVLGLSLDTVPALEPAAAGDDVVVDRTRDRVVTTDRPPAADEPLTAERHAAAEREAAMNAEPSTVTVGPSTARDRSRIDE
jgi:hypothetical protein